jgi:Ca-activated chloride channel family protein
LLFLIPLLVVFYVNLQHRRQRVAERYGSFGLLQSADRGVLGRRRHLPPALFLAGLWILTFSLARPQMEVSLPREEGIAILAFDVSGSMTATDLQPTRMDAAKAAALEFVQRQPAGVQIGVVAFSDGGFEVQNPSDDQETILASINRLTPERGTSIANGIVASLKTIVAAHGNTLAVDENGELAAEPEGEYPSAVIILLTDGENTAPGDPFEAAQAAKDRDVRIYTVGVGSAAGSTIEVEGFTVHSQLDETTLRQISELTSAEYFNASDETELSQIYQNLSPQWIIKSENIEVTAIFAGASILVLLLGGALSLIWFGRVP